MLKNPDFRTLLESDVYLHKTYSMGTVDEKNRLNFYHGRIRVVDPEGKEFAKYPATEYEDHIAERVEPWTYLKFPYLKEVGWKGFVDGMDSGVYAATPLTRLNVSDRLATPLAQEHFERLTATFGGRPVHHRLATHWARLIELLYAAERMLVLAADPEILDPHVRNMPKWITGVGIGSVEAPRGTLTHHYVSDERGVLTSVNLIVGTTNNHAPITMSIKRAAERLITKGHIVEEGLLNRIEMAFRLYDPCLSCATHHLPGQMPMSVTIRDSQNTVLRVLRRDA